MNYCNECDSELLDGSVYCGVCGERINDAPSIYNRYKEKSQYQAKPKHILYPKDGGQFDWVEKEQTLYLRISIYILMLSSVILVIISLTYLFQSLALLIIYLLLGILQYISSVALSSFHNFSRLGVVISTIPVIIISLFRLELFLVILIFYGIVYYSLFLDQETIIILSSNNYMRQVSSSKNKKVLDRRAKRLLVEKYFGNYTEPNLEDGRKILQGEHQIRDSIYSKIYQVKDE